MLKNRRFSDPAPDSRPKRPIPIEPIAVDSQLQPIKLVEEESWYELTLPLAEIDPDKIFVLARPNALLIETRAKSQVDHLLGDETVTEHIKQSISREFRLPTEIEYGETRVEIQAETLLVKALKSSQPQAPWSEFVRFNTRGSFGCV